MAVPAPAYPPAHGLLKGKTVLITAAAGTGIGFATAKRCAEEGASIFISDVHERRLHEAVAKIEAETGVKAKSHLCNVTKEDEVRALVAAAVDQMGHVDVLVNNASVLGWRAQKLQAHYAAAKAGVMALTRCAAVEAAEHGIRINAVSPSLAMHEFLNRVTSDELLAQLTSREAYGRAAETWEIANVIVFLASEYATYMTGEVVAVSSQRA